MKIYQRQLGMLYYKNLDESIESQMEHMVVSDTRRTHSTQWVNVYNFDKKWSHTKQYISPDGTGDSQPQNMFKAHKFFEMCVITRHRLYGACIMTAVKIDVRGVPQILDGRHRYCILRDVYNQEKVPMSMDEESAENAERFNLLWQTSTMQ